MKCETKTTPGEMEAESYGLDYGLAIGAALRYAGDDIQEGLFVKLLGIPDAKKVISYGRAIGYALEFAGNDIQENLIDRILSIPDAEEAESYGMAICDALYKCSIPDGDFINEDEVVDGLLGIIDALKAKT